MQNFENGKELLQLFVYSIINRYKNSEQVFDIQRKYMCVLHACVWW